ncbi:unnamed protein product [Brachionus calyciflorus]|uniref:MYCBP-associated protein n=1 Tax=Brachionus calyciflorus TaxID=104777 RepID=A0A814E7S4_9BILA|nr:unnamed protein product [Brachionus calyciflorus]
MSTVSRADTKLRKEKPKKKTDEIGKLSPTHSEIEEKLTFKTIDGEDIQNLAIKDDDLQKLKKPKSQTLDAIEKEILVKKVDKTAFPKIEVKVAKLAPERPIKPIDVSDNLGIRFDKYGNCVPYSILGNIEDYLQEAVSNGKSIDLPYETLDSDKPKADLYLKETNSNVNSSKKFKPSLNGDSGENALNNWQDKMDERKNTQNVISKKINRSIDGLVMNQSDKAQQYNEIKTLLDRTLPLVEHGKGYRLGSEFWNQPLRIGNDETGLFTTLKKSEQGILGPIELISKPLSTLKESDFCANQPPVSHYPWHESKYLNQRLKKLEPLISELIPHRPQFSRLEIIGKNPLNPNDENEEVDLGPKNGSNSDYIIVDDTWINQNIINKENKENLNNPYFMSEEQDPEILAVHPNVVQGPIFGPCIVFGGQTADWTGNDLENAGIVALESRLNFETKAGKRVLATFEIHNIGTTSIYYDWRKLQDPNPFQMTNSKVQRFYFDTRSNVILPGDVLKMHIVFKSNIGGIFTEKWEFVTHPRLLSAASLVLTLRGVAVQEDKFKKNRILLEKKLFLKEAEIIAQSIVDLILSGVRTPERCASPERAYMTEEDLFIEKNPQFFYDHETVNELKSLYLELFDESERSAHINEWDLSVNNFKTMIMSMNDEDDSKKQDLLFKLNYLIEKISFRAYVPTNSTMYNACYNTLCSAIDEICTDLNKLKANLNLPIILLDDPYPTYDEKERRYEEWKREFEVFKQIEQEKKNRLEKEKGKDTKSKKGGTAQGDKKDDKKKDEKKKTTPTPAAGSKSRISRMETSRSASQAQDKNDERTKTPIVLNERQILNREIFKEKAYIDVYELLIKTVDNIEKMFHESYSKQDDIKLLESFIMQKQYLNMAPMNSDFID